MWRPGQQQDVCSAAPHWLAPHPPTPRPLRLSNTNAAVVWFLPLLAGMVKQGLSPTEAASRFYVLDHNGLITEQRANLEPHVKPFARKDSESKGAPGCSCSHGLGGGGDAG